MMAVAAAQKNREMFAIKKSYSIEVSFGISILHMYPYYNISIFLNEFIQI